MPTHGQALVHLLMLACLRGIAVRGPVAGNEQAYALTRDWLGAPPVFDRERSLRELARRFLAGHAPADARDLARWAGLPLRDARAGLEGVASELDQRADGLVALRRHRPPAPELPPPRLLGPWDPVLLGWVSREPLLGPHRDRVTVEGVFRPFALVRGRGAATWRLQRAAIEISPFAPLRPEDAAALDADAAAVLRYLGLDAA